MCRSILRVMLFCLNSPSKKHAVMFVFDPTALSNRAN